jgi:uncharacterized protein (TIGR00159 family)
MFPTLISFLEELRQRFRIADALDILLIAVLLYSALVWFKQTASRRVIIGVSVVTALYFLARALDMYLTSLVFHTGFAVVLIVLVVVFQEEIRRLLERAADWGTWREPRRKPAMATEADTLVEGAFALAANKTGALIVLQGREPLERQVDGGIELSGHLSKPLLYSIFDPSSAGHDGAVIVERDRVERFGAHLPISKNQKEIRGRGTRHSAALGLSERSDALVIVVSEERGAVSVAERGRLIDVSTASDLKGRVEQFFEERFPAKGRPTWRRLITRHGRLKLLALLVAVVAWFVLAFDVERIQTSFVVPIEYRNVPESAQIDQSAPVEALVTLSGSERAFRMLDRRVLRISVDLSEVRHGEERVPITDQNLSLPPNLKVDRIQPEEIRIRLNAPPRARSPATLR